MDRVYEAALQAYQIINPDGPAFSTLSDYDQNRWRQAYGVARMVEPTVIEMSCPMYLTETSFDYARSLVGGTPAKATLVIASVGQGKMLRDLAKSVKCKTMEVPYQALKTPYTWILVSPDGLVWSAPTD